MFRHILIKLILLVCFSVQIKAQINDRFSDGNFSSNPLWVGDSVNWRVNNLQLNSNLTNTLTQSYIATSSALAVKAHWEFYTELRFATSSQNYADVFLISDSFNLQGVNSGIFVRIGNTADEISLYRKDGNLTTKIIDGTDGRVGSSSSNIFSIKVIRDANNEFRLFTDNTGTGNNYLLEGSVVENDFITSRYFGFLIKSSASNLQKFYFDDVIVEPMIADTLPPIADSVWAEDSFHCVVYFNELPDTLSTSKLLNFTLNGVLHPVSAHANNFNAKEVLLQFTDPFTDDSWNSLKIENIYDLAGNGSVTQTKTFLHHPLRDGDIIINEIFADPSPSIGLPPFEFVELWNVSGYNINLQGFQLTDGNSTASFPSLLLPRDSFLIVSAPASLQSFAVFGRSLAISGFPGLNNDRDNLLLVDKNNHAIDEVAYDVSWYKDVVKKEGGWSLEMRHPKARCKNGYNWGASTQAIYGGTPGTTNSLFDSTFDTLRPIATFEMLNDSMAWMIFNTVMDSQSVMALQFSGLSKILEINVTTKNADSVLLRFEALQNQVLYQLAISNAASCNGVKMKPYSTTFTHDKTFAAQFNHVIVSEVLLNSGSQQALPNSQYIELHNRGNYSINLQGMKISDGTSVAVLPFYKLMKDSFILIAPFTKINEFTFRKMPALPVSNFPYLNSESDKLVVTDSLNRVLHIASYHTKTVSNTLKASGGWSLELTDVQSPCALAGNWQFSQSPIGGTPNRTNSIKGMVADNEIITFMRAYTLTNRELVLLFNKGIDVSLTATQIRLHCNTMLLRNYTVSYFNKNLNELSIVFTAKLFENDSIYQIELENIFDCGGNSIKHTKFITGLPSEPQYGEMVLNEILFNAHAYGSEFIELHNNSTKIFELKNIILHVFEKTGILKGSVPLAAENYQLLPGSYLAIGADAPEIRKRYKPDNPENITSMPNWITFDDDTGTLVLANFNSMAPVDTANYSKQWHHAYIANDEGVSLEKINYSFDGRNRNNWLSASSNAGYATPGQENSKYTNTIEAEGSVTLSSGFFTPNNDGVDDALRISLQLPASNFALNITIFDRHGNEITRLARNEIAGTTNHYFWDGRTETGIPANTGHYILVAAITDSNGNTKSVKRVVDLLME